MDGTTQPPGRAGNGHGFESLAKMDRTHVSLYPDPEIFHEEMEKIFYTTWVFVGHDSEIPGIGDYKTTFIGQRPVIVVRDENNDIQVLMNRCMHRGAAVCAREKGNAASFVCPYHAWEYRLDGALAAVGMPRGYNPGELDFSALGLVRAPRVDRYRGLIFASLKAEGVALSEHLGNAKQYIDAYADQSPAGEIIVGQSGVNRHSYRGNWKIQVEGSVEGYPAPFTHATALAVMAERMAFPQNFQGLKLDALDLGHGHNLLQIYSLPDEAVEQRYTPEHIASLTARLGRERAYECLRNRWNLVIFPNLAILEYQLREIRPISVDLTEVRLHHVLLKDVSDELNTRRVREHEFFYGPASFGGPDDYAIFDRIQEGYRVQQAPWILLNRGIESETTEANGIRKGGHTQETVQRAPYYEYRRLMAD
jgi:phenylpropionate dioxygenase-like ring-hydroxylating dioxygenase large terminal subunit